MCMGNPTPALIALSAGCLCTFQGREGPPVELLIGEIFHGAVGALIPELGAPTKAHLCIVGQSTQ